MHLSLNECRNCKSSPYVDHDCEKGTFVVGCPHMGCQERSEKNSFYLALRNWNEKNMKTIKVDEVMCEAEIGGML